MYEKGTCVESKLELNGYSKARSLFTPGEKPRQVRIRFVSAQTQQTNVPYPILKNSKKF